MRQLLSSAPTAWLKQSAGPRWRKASACSVASAFRDKTEPNRAVPFQEMFLQEISNLKKCARRTMASTDELRPGPVEYIVGKKGSPMKPHKPAGRAPSGHNLQAGQRRRRNVAVMQQKLPGDSRSTGRAMKLPEKLPKLELGREGSKLPRSIHSAAASETKAQLPGHCEFRARSEKEAERLEGEAGTVLREVTGKQKPLAHPVCSSRRAPQKSSPKVLRSAKRAEPSKTPRFSHEQEIARLAWDVAGRVLKKAWK